MVRPLLVALLTALAGLVGPALAQPASEQAMRAAMIFNFLKFTEFPTDTASAAQHLRLCYSVADPAQAESLASLSGRKVGNRDLIVARLGDVNERCHAIYVDSRQRWNAVLESRGSGGALTISSYRGFAMEGGIVEIDMERDGNRFEINLAQARQARLRLAPQLLRLARQVHE